MTNFKVQIKHKVQMAGTKGFDIKAFVINLVFGFWHLTFVTSWRSMPWAMCQ